MIIEKIGNIWTSQATVLLHGTNCQGIMGAGIAKQIASRFPAVESQYRAFCADRQKRSELLLGEVLISDGITSRDNPHLRAILNCFTQSHYGRDRRYVDYDAIDRCMARVAEFIKATCPDPRVKPDSRPLPPALAMPRIGAGLGGGDWTIIRQSIDRHLGTLPHTTEIWSLA